MEHSVLPSWEGLPLHWLDRVIRFQAYPNATAGATGHRQDLPASAANAMCLHVISTDSIT